MDKPLQAIYKTTLSEKYVTLPNRHRNNSQGNKVITRKTKSFYLVQLLQIKVLPQ